ncbi:MAG TPA: DUF192 domain-containing protein [Anaerolineales bacterium]|nr:DUF192 domain-containing protein [Anaerolineales bacterium]
MPSDILVQNQNKPIDHPARVGYCDSFFCRLRGLMFRRFLPREEGLMLVIGRDSRADSSIHMLFVSFDLAVFWINSEMCVVDKVIAKSWRPAYFPAQAARYTLEIHPDRYDEYQIGDRVQFQNA